MEHFFNYESITAGQYHFLYNVLSFTFAAFLAGAIGLFIAASIFKNKHRITVTIAGIVSLIAAYHYFRIFGSWEGAFEWTATGISKTNQPFNLGYRYADWILTVPLLMIELVDILDLKKGKGKRLATWLALGAVLMIGLGYPGEVASTEGNMWLWWVLSMIPFVFIFGYLVFYFGKHLENQHPKARPYINSARWLTACIWWVYPVLYLFPIFGWTDGESIVVVNTLYAIADITAKVGLGLLITAAAYQKFKVEKSAA